MFGNLPKGTKSSYAASRTGAATQDAEISAYERTKADLERAKETMSGNALINYWESQNDKLRNLGIRPLTLESLE